LAFLPPPELDAYLAQAPFDPMTVATITTAQALRRDLVRTRDRGYALRLDELEEGLHAVSAGIWVGGTPVAVISVSGPSFRLPETVVHRLGQALAEEGRRIGAQLDLQTA
jgi:IclR family acetate operon transcriptional repressor